VVNVVERGQVGEKLPKGWKWATLSNICDFRNGINFTGSQKGSGLLTIDVFNMYSDSVYVSMDKLYRVDITSKDAYLLEPNDILFVRSSVKQEGVGWATLFPGYHEPVSFCGFIIRARLIDKNVDPQFLIYYLRCASIRNWIILRSSTGTITNISQENLQPLTIPLPPLSEQKRLVGILSDRLSTIDKARAATEAQLKAAKALPAAYLRQVFDSPEAQKFASCSIGKVAKVQSGYAFKSNWFTPSGIRLLRNANVSQGFISWDDVVHIPNTEREKFLTFELSEGDIVLSLDRPLVNNGLKVSRLSSFDVPSLLLQRVGRFQLSGDVDTGYLYAFLNSPKFIDSISGHDQSIGVPHISPKQVESMKIPLPSLEEQQILAKRVWEKISLSQSLCTSLQSQLDTINKLPAALLRQAFNGEL
jgi:type I restriction enzyme, S subunit